MEPAAKMKARTLVARILVDLNERLLVFTRSDKFEHFEKYQLPQEGRLRRLMSK